MVNSATKLLNAREVCQILGISKSTLHRMIRRGEFSPPLKPSPGTSRWPRQEVDDYIEALQRRDGPSEVDNETPRSTGINDGAVAKDEN